MHRWPDKSLIYRFFWQRALEIWSLYASKLPSEGTFSPCHPSECHDLYRWTRIDSAIPEDHPCRMRDVVLWTSSGFYGLRLSVPSGCLHLRGFVSPLSCALLRSTRKSHWAHSLSWNRKESIILVHWHGIFLIIIILLIRSMKFTCSLSGFWETMEVTKRMKYMTGATCSLPPGITANIVRNDIRYCVPVLNYRKTLLYSDAFGKKS